MKKIKTKSFELAVYSKGSPKSEKLAIVIPGRLDTKDYFHNTSLVDYLSQKGYIALSFDPPGTWESGGDIELYTTTNYIIAVNELIEFFGNKPSLVVGHSRGGTIAMLVGPKNSHVTHFVSIFSHYGSPESPKKDRIMNGRVVSYRDLPPGKIKSELKKKFELPIYYFEDGSRYNALAGLKKCKKPKLFFFGTKDEFIGEDVVERISKESSDPKEIHRISSVHDYRYQPEAVEEINNLIGEFLDNH